MGSRNVGVYTDTASKAVTPQDLTTPFR